MPNSSNKYSYSPLISRLKSVMLKDKPSQALDSPDRRDGTIYDYDDELHLAVEISLATGRPLLLRGDPGTGKSSLAAFVARNLGWRYYEHTVTSDTRAQDLLWRYDVVRRLADAQARTANSPPLNDLDYVEPGVLWWVFNPDSAKQRGYLEASKAKYSSVVGPNKNAQDPNQDSNKDRAGDRAVVLIDELDKADPEVPNALLVPLGSNKFWVSDIGVEITWEPRKDAAEAARNEPELRSVEMSRLLVIITTNEERELPPAFLRRCVVRYLHHPDAGRLEQIAKLHFERAGQPFGEAEKELSRRIAERVVKLRSESESEAVRPPSTAEYLDALRACLTLEIEISDEEGSEWDVLERATLLKSGTEAEEDDEEDDDQR